MKHKDKIKLARKMLTKKEKKNHTAIFLSSAWERRSNSKANKMRMDRVKARDKRKIKELAS
jgi:hypothetical protein